MSLCLVEKQIIKTYFGVEIQLREFLSLP